MIRGEQVVQISAANVAFSTSTLTAPANAGFTIHFDNQDAGVPHNVDIKDSGGKPLFTN